MTAAGWLAAVARRGGAARLDEQRRVCVRPARALTPALRADFPALHVALVAALGEPALVAALGQLASDPAPERPGATLLDALDVFPGARVVADGQPPVWPPPGGWIPSPGQRVDHYTADPVVVPCPWCASVTWHQAGDGWTCSACHPPPRTPQQEVTR